MTNERETQRRGRVYLVGAGPGDPGLITLRGVEYLSRADLVLYDYLVNPQILEHAPETAEKCCLGRHGAGRLMTMAESCEAMISAARAGKQVVRLKAGDPAIFARVREEIDALNSAGIEFEMTPGVTAAIAAGSYAGVPLTSRDQASAVAFVTGHEEPEKPESNLDYAGLARFPGTLVFYMGVTTAPRWTSALIEHGKPADTRAAIVRRVSWHDQRTIVCGLSEVAEVIARERLRPPLIVIVGDVAAAEAAATWFTRRALFGKTVLITRPAEQSSALRGALAELGARVMEQPAIEISEPRDWTKVDDAMSRIETFDWLVFSSVNGVRMLLDRLWRSGRDARALGKTRIAAIGPATGEALEAYGLRADLVPDEFRAEALAESLANDAKGRRFLLARASRGREILAETLRAAGGDVEQVVVYESTDVDATGEDVREALAAGKIDWTIVSSSAIARSLARLFGEDLKKSKLASISPVTSATLREFGLQPAVEAQTYTLAGIVDAIRAREAHAD